MVANQASQRGSFKRSKTSTMALRTAEMRPVNTSGTKNGRPTIRSASKARLASSQFAAFLLSVVMEISSAAQNFLGSIYRRKHLGEPMPPAIQPYVLLSPHPSRIEHVKQGRALP